MKPRVAIDRSRLVLVPSDGYKTAMGVTFFALTIFSFLPHRLPLLIAAMSWVFLAAQIALFIAYRASRRAKQRRLNRLVDGEVMPTEPFTLYLRPFLTAGAIQVQNPLPDRTDRLFVGKWMDVEFAVAFAITSVERFIAVGDKKESLGAEKILNAGDHWFTTVLELARRATCILAVPLARPSTLEEMIAISRSPELLRKTIFLMPPERRSFLLFSQGYGKLWEGARSALAAEGLHLPAYDRSGAFVRFDQADKPISVPVRRFRPDYVRALLSAASEVGAGDRVTNFQEIPNAFPEPRTHIAESVFSVIIALAIAMVLRWTVVQPFRIPSGSMQPTLLVGDYMVVSKWSYGYSRFSMEPLNFGVPAGRIFEHQPQRGDVVVFRPVPQEDKDLVKRLIGLPGDKIQVVDGHLIINGVPVRRESAGVVQFKEQFGDYDDIQTWRETLPNGKSYVVFDRQPGNDGRLDTTDVFEVPPGNYFFMGDDRDNSADSRTPEVSYVPFENIVGKVQFVALSYDPSTSWFKPWTLITGLRSDRFAKPVH